MDGLKRQWEGWMSTDKLNIQGSFYSRAAKVRELQDICRWSARCLTETNCLRPRQLFEKVDDRTNLKDS